MPYLKMAGVRFFTVVATRIYFQWHKIANHTILNTFLKAFGQVFRNDFSKTIYSLFVVIWYIYQIVFDCFYLFVHFDNFSFFKVNKNSLLFYRLWFGLVFLCFLWSNQLHEALVKPYGIELNIETDQAWLM